MSPEQEAVLARSSLGTDEVRFIAAWTSREDLDRVLCRVREIEDHGAEVGCEPTWVQAARDLEPTLVNLPDIDQYQEQQ